MLMAYMITTYGIYIVLLIQYYIHFSIKTIQKLAQK